DTVKPRSQAAGVLVDRLGTKVDHRLNKAHRVMNKLPENIHPALRGIVSVPITLVDRSAVREETDRDRARLARARRFRAHQAADASGKCQTTQGGLDAPSRDRTGSRTFRMPASSQAESTSARSWYDSDASPRI